MKRYKKRTIALILASVVTIAGTFGSENYKNAIMDLSFGINGNTTDVTIVTQSNYEKKINPTKINSDTYIIMLPEVKESIVKMPTLPNTIDRIDIKTMPYTKNSTGYTKITIKTLNNTNISTKNSVYIPKKETSQLEDRNTSEYEQKLEEIERQKREEYYRQREYNRQKQYENSKNAQFQTKNNSQKLKNTEQYKQNQLQNESVSEQNKNINENSLISNNNSASEENISVNSELNSKETNPNINHTELSFILLGILLVIITTIFFYVKGKNKIAEILGEQTDFDINDEEPVKKVKKEKKETNRKKDIKSVINKLDKKYQQPINKITIPASIDQTPKEIEVVENDNIVDLDEILNSQNQNNSSSYNTEIQMNDSDKKEETENIALEEFLKAYTFEEDENNEENNDEQILFNEEMYNKYITDDSLTFSNDDIAKIQKLLNSEINDDTIKNINQYLITNPIEKKSSRTELLENLVSTYTINQNIVFSEQDIEALNKLMNVELDNDFITDLRTNPERIKIMQEEIQNQKAHPHKKSEILTLNVKDMLPNLSDALKKQGNKEIKSEYKPQVIYYSEGYDVNTISLKDQLPDLSVEINNKESYISRPSDEIEYSVSGYDVDKLSVSDEFLDLDAMLKQDEKQNAIKSTPMEVDEEQLLKNITNVTFKPFYSENDKNSSNEEAPSFSDIQAEFKELGNVEIIKEENDLINTNPNEEEKDDFESLFSNEYFDLDKTTNTDLNQENSDNKAINAQDLLNIIEQKQAEKQKRKEEQKNNKTNLENKSENNNEIDIKESEPNTCIVDNSIYEIVSTTHFTEKMGCYLAKNNSGYCILGFVGEKLFKIKYYEKLKSEKIQARKTDKIDEDNYRYIVRIGIHKFIMNVSKDNMEYVMDLC